MPIKNFYFEKIKTNIGQIFILENKKGICAITKVQDPRVIKLKKKLQPEYGLKYHKKIKKNLIQYLDKKEKLLKFPITFIEGTKFQIHIWRQLQKIKYGQTSYYSLIAKKINNIHSARAVGTAISKNPIMIYIPCHRVITKSGNMGGYVYGNSLKKKLLDLEYSKDG